MRIIARAAASLGLLAAVPAQAVTLTTLVNFSGTANGSRPLGSLIADVASDLYGATSSGGANNRGTVFKLAAGDSALTTLVTFDLANGAVPQAGLILDATGNLYGTALNGGIGRGTVFRLEADGALTKLASFTGTPTLVSGSYASLMADAAGNLYGTTSFGGSGNGGTLFRLSDAGFALTALPAVGDVPEPATWATILLGFSLVGRAMRTRRKVRLALA